MLGGALEEAIRIAREALAIAEALALDELRAHALTTIGSSMNRIQLWTGREELEEALEIGLAANSPVAATTLNNLAVMAVWEGDFRRGDELYPKGQELAERFGDRDGLRFMRGNAIYAAFALGRWDEAAEAAAAFVAECVSSPHYSEGIVREARASIRLARGDLTGAAEDREFVLEHARRVKDPQRILPSLAAAALNLVLLDKPDEARAAAEETIAVTRENVGMTSAASLLVLVAGPLGVRDEFGAIVELSPEGPWKDLTRAGVRGELRRAADLYAEFGCATFEAYARLFAGEEAIEAGRRAEGAAEIERAIGFFRSVGAELLVRRGESFLAGAYSDSA
jgi:tetratricopeptide (TPR) repeat protein